MMSAMSESITSVAGRTVRLFLADGLPQGMIIADVGNWNGKALAAPRGRLPELLRRPEASRTGVYILLGPNPDQVDGVLAYIGEADDIANRMRIHLRSESKDFFDRVVFLVSSDEMLTKGHVRYLESRLIKLTQDAGSVVLTNDTHPDFQRLPEADRADMDTFVDNAALVLPILGCDLFRRRQRAQAAIQADRVSSDDIGAPSSPSPQAALLRLDRRPRKASSSLPGRRRGARPVAPSQQVTPPSETSWSPARSW